MKSKKFDKVKHYYERGLWSEYAVRNAIKMGWITEEEYHIIVEANDEQNG